MPQLTKGARAALNKVAALSADITAELQESRAKAKFDPDETRERIDAALNYLDSIQRVMDEQIAPLLERQAPEYEKRLSELEQRMRDIEQQQAGIIVPLRRKAEG